MSLFSFLRVQNYNLKMSISAVFVYLDWSLLIFVLIYLAICSSKNTLDILYFLLLYF